MPQQNLQWIYDSAIKNGLQIGEYDQFTDAMKDENNRKWLYDGLSKKDVELGDYNQFNEQLESLSPTDQLYGPPDPAPVDSVDYDAENILSHEISSPDSSVEKITQAGFLGSSAEAGKDVVHSSDHNIPQINDRVWGDIFKEKYNKNLNDALPEEAIDFAINRILFNSEGDSPLKIQNWEAYNNGSWAKYKDYTNEDYVAVMGADPKHLAMIDSLAGPEASTIKAVFAAESDFDSSKINTNYMPSKESGIESDGSAAKREVGIYGLEKVDVAGEPKYTISQAPEESISDRFLNRLGNMWKYRDLSISGPSKEATGARATVEFNNMQFMKDRAAKIGIYHHPRSPKFDKEVREQVAWNTMSAPMLFTGPQTDPIGRMFGAAAVKGRFGIGELGKAEYDERMRRMANPREHYRRRLKEIGLDVTDGDFMASAWTNSLSGMAWSIATGNTPDLTFYQPSDQEQIAAGIMGLMMPLDAISFGVGSTIAKGAVKTAGMFTSKQLLKLGVSSSTVNRGIALGKSGIAQGMIGMGGALGTYEGLGSPLRQWTQLGYIDGRQWAKDVVAHTALGMVTGALGEGGMAFGKYVRPVGRGSKLIPEGSKFVGEVIGFGGFSPMIVEGEAPEWHDFYDAAAFLIGMKLAAPMQQIYGKGSYDYVKTGVSKMLRMEYLRNGKDFSKAQETVHNELKSAVDIAMEGNIAWEKGSPSGVSTGGKGVILGEKPNLSVDKNGVAIIYDEKGNRIPFKPSLTQRELVLSGEIKREKVDSDGNPVIGPDGKAEMVTVAHGRGQVPEKTPGETMVQEAPEGSGVVYTEPVVERGKVVKEGVYTAVYGGKNVGEFATRAEANAKIEGLTKESVPPVPVSKAVAEQLEVPAHLRKEALQGQSDAVLDTMYKQAKTPREKQIIRVEQERRKLTAPKEEDVSSLVQERGALQVEQNRLFEELQALPEGSPEYIRKEQQIVEMGDRMQTLDNQIAGKVVPVEEAKVPKAEEPPKKKPPKEEPPVEPEAPPKFQKEPTEVPPVEPTKPPKKEPPSKKELDAAEEKLDVLFNKETELIKEAFGKDSDVEDIIIGEEVGKGIDVAGETYHRQRWEINPEIKGELTKSQRDKAQKLADEANAIERKLFGPEAKEPVEKAPETKEPEPAKEELQSKLDKYAPDLEAELNQLIEKNKNAPFLTESDTKELQERLDASKGFAEVVEARLEKFTDEALSKASEKTKEMWEADVNRLIKHNAEVTLLEAELAKRGGGTAEAPVSKKIEPKKWVDITGSKGNKLGEFDQLQEGGGYFNYGIRKNKKGGDFEYKIVEKKADEYGVRHKTVEGEVFDTYEKAFNALADRIARLDSGMDRSKLVPELQKAVLDIEATFDHPALRKNRKEDLVDKFSKRELIDIADETIHQPGVKGFRYQSLGSLPKPKLVDAMLSWQKQGDVARKKTDPELAKYTEPEAPAPVGRPSSEIIGEKINKANLDIEQAALKTKYPDEYSALTTERKSEGVDGLYQELYGNKEKIDAIEKDLKDRKIRTHRRNDSSLDVNLVDLSMKSGSWKDVSHRSPKQLLISLAKGEQIVEKAPPKAPAKEPKPLTDKERENIEEKLLGEFGYKRGEVVNEERLLEQPADFEKASQLLSLGEVAYYAEKPLTDTVVAWSDGVRLGEFGSKAEAHKVLNKYVKKHHKGIRGIVGPDVPKPLFEVGEKVKLSEILGKKWGAGGETVKILSNNKVRVGNEWKYEVQTKGGERFWTNELGIMSRPARSAKPVSENLAKAKVSGDKKKVEAIEDAEKGKVREDEPKAVLELLAERAKIDAKMKAEFKKKQPNEDKIQDLAVDRLALTEEIGKAKLGKPRTGDQVTLTPTKKTKKGEKKVVKKPIDDPAMRGKIELQNIFESIRDQVEIQIAESGVTGNEYVGKPLEINWDRVVAPENSRFVDTPVGGRPGVFRYDLEINLPNVNGTYSVNVPESVIIKGGKIDLKTGGGAFFGKFSKANITKAFKNPTVPTLRGASLRGPENAPQFTAPARKSLAQQDHKALNTALSGYKKRLKKYQAYKEPTGDVQRSIGELKEAIKIAEDLVKVQKEADRLGGAVVGMDFIPGTTAFFNAMRRWKRSKLPISDRKKLDSLIKRSNKLHNKWVAEGRVDREMEGRLGKLSDEIVALENKVKNQIPSETEMVNKIAQDIKWPSRTTDLRRTHKKERVLNEKMRENLELGADPERTIDPSFRDIKLQVTKGRSDSQKDFTKEEIVLYEEILDRMTNNGGYLDDMPVMLTELSKNENLWANKVHQSFGFAFSNISRIKAMGAAGRELAQKATDFVIRQTQLTGDGEATLYRIGKLIGRKNMKYFSAAVDPYLAEGVDFKGKNKEKFLNDPKTKEAVRIWRGYTDRLHALRVEHDTYVVKDIDGKKIKVDAADTYIDNWLRRQLKVDVYKELVGGGKKYEREIERLMKRGIVKTRAEAEQAIGAWLRRSPYYEQEVRYGSADRPRLLELSPDLYETDFTIIAPGITRRYATFLAGAEVFTQDMKVRDELVGRIGTTVGGKNSIEASEIMQNIIEGSRHQPPWGFMGATRGISTLHLTSPRTFYNNIMYSHNTDYPAMGTRAVIKGWVDFLKHPIASLMTAREAGQLGVGVREIEAITFEKGLKRWLGWFPGGIIPSELGNRGRATISAGTAAEMYLRYMKNDISPEIMQMLPRRLHTKLKAKTGRLFFQDFGGFSNKQIDKIVERGYLTDAEIKRMETFLPSVTQGSTHPYFMPEMFSGKLSFLGGLQKMAYRATAGAYKAAWKPAAHGDFGPMARWIAAGAIGGELSYYINYLLFGWEHPEGGDIDNFIEYLHGDAANKDKMKASLLRVGQNMLRASGFGIMSDWFRGYGIAPVIFDAYKNVHNEMGYLLTGKKSFLQIKDDVGEAQIAIYRDLERFKKARRQPRSAEYRNYSNVKRYKSKFIEDIRPQKKQDTQYTLSDNSLPFREIREAWWKVDADEMERVMYAARKTIGDRKVALRETAEGKFELKGKDQYKGLERWGTIEAQKSISGLIRGMHPLDGISGNLVVTVDGKRYTLKSSTSKSPDANIFWEGLKPHQQRNVLKAVEDYKNIYKELKLSRYVK